MKKIYLTNGYVALVDDDDYIKISKYNWCIHTDKRNIYAARKKIKEDEEKSSQIIKMHKQILNVIEKDVQIDHIDGNGLNNQKSNLRIVTRSQNLMNTKKRSNCSSLYKGVYWNKLKQKWRAQITINGKKKTIGNFKEEIEAANAYDLFAFKHFGEFARLNFSIDNKISCLDSIEKLKEETDDAARININNTSGYIGVDFIKKSSKWRSRINEKHIGYFNSAIEAAKAHDIEALKNINTNTRLNFPKEKYDDI